MQSIVTAADIRHMPMGDGAKLVALPPEAHELLANGMQPSLVHELYQPKDRAAVTGRLLQTLEREAPRDEVDVELFFDRIDTDIDRHQIKRGRGLLYWQMTGGEKDHPDSALTLHVMGLIGPRAHQWRGHRMDGDIYAHIAMNAEFVAWWLANDQRLDLPAWEYKEALANQLAFWASLQLALARGL